MPPEIREQYLLALKAMRMEEGKELPDTSGRTGSVTHTSFVYNGQTYQSRDELPPEVREALDHMPEPKPGENQTRVDIITTKSLPSQLRISEKWPDGIEQRSPKEISLLPWSLVVVLGVIVVVLLLLWLSGVRPASLWR